MGSWQSGAPRVEMLRRGGFARLLYELGHGQTTGLLRVALQHQALDLLAVRRGRLLCTPSDMIGRLARRRLANLASRPHLRVEFDPTSRAHPPGGSHSLCLASWARQHIEGQLDARRATELARRLRGAVLHVPSRRAPATRLLDSTDQRILELLATPCPFEDIGPRARAPRFRLMSFLHFLGEVGALSATGARAGHARVNRPASRPTTSGPSRALRTLGVPPGVGPDELKRVYRRLVRSLHPDLHPGADERERRALERRLAEVNSAYRELSTR